MYHVWPISEHFIAWVTWWQVTGMLSLAEHWQSRQVLSNHVCAHSVISIWHMICLQHLGRACSGQSRSITVLLINHVIQMPQCLLGFVNHDYWNSYIFMETNAFENDRYVDHQAYHINLSAGLIQLVSPWTKWLPFLQTTFQMHFHEWKICIYIWISLNFVHKGSIDSKWPLVQVMAWRWVGSKPLPESMLILFTNAFMRH